MSVHVEPVESILRVFHCEAELDPYKDAYDAIGTVHYHHDVAIAYGFHGKLRYRDLLEIAKACKKVGAKYLLANRREGHTLPMGKLMPEGPFGGWWYVDLDEVLREWDK